jgi:uncharacterized protein involved in response to NO
MSATINAQPTSHAAGLPFDDRTSVREILARWPSTREAFERAGLMGCGGIQGPDEPLAFFANVHHVPLEGLKRSLADAIGGTGLKSRRELPVAPASPLAFEPVHRYKPFLLWSVGLTLTFGATLGMINLARLTTPWFGGMPLNSVRAHAFVQVFGFVGLFVMGIACHVLPRFAGRPLAAAALARTMLVLQLGGLFTIVAAFLVGSEVIRGLWALGSMALIAAASMFGVIVARTVGGLRTPEPFARWIIAGAAWQVVAAVGSLVAALQDAEVLQALWPAALWGFAGSWIFGIGRRIFPGFLAWRPRGPRAEPIAFLTYQAAVAFSVAAAWPWPSEPPMPVVVVGAAGLLLSVPLFSWCLGVRMRPQGRHDVERGYQRFVAAGWFWLVAALLVGPFWTLLAAFRGDVVPALVTDFGRHALAFGFVTQIMMGVATRILPVFTGNTLWSPRARTASFYLLNGSVALRGLEAVVAVGVLPAAWPLIAVAGPPAVVAVALFGLNVTLTIYGRPAAAQARGTIGLPDRRISEILEISGALDVLVEAGFTPLKNPMMRAAMAGSVTLRQACGLKGIALEPLAARIEALQRKPRTIALTPVR